MNRAATTETSAQEQAASRDTLARRLGQWSTNLLVSGIVVILGLVLGREMLGTWRAVAPAALAESSRPRKYQGPVPVTVDLENADVQFGEFAGKLRRGRVHGDVATVLDALRRSCREMATTGAPAVRRETVFPGRDQLLTRAPVEREPGRWAIYELEHPLPMAIAVEDSVPGAANVETDKPQQPAVLAWGIAFPDGDEPGSSWRLFTFNPYATAAAEDPDQWLPLPAGCERLVAVSADAENLLGFRSESDPRTLAERWDAMQSNGWRAAEPWRHVATGWQRTFVRGSGETARVRLSAGSDGETFGFVLQSAGL